MKTTSRPLDPRRLDMAAFAASAGELAGDVALGSLTRLADSVLAAEPEGAATHWQAAGELRPVTGGEPEIWLHLTAQACVSMRCQRCLAPMAVPLDVDRRIRFVRDAGLAEALDAELEDDVLELLRHVDLLELLEDELLLALPLVPRHDACPQPLPLGDDTAGAASPDAEPRPNPFAALARLKTGKPGG
jgi:uncharacterized protein